MKHLVPKTCWQLLAALLAAWLPLCSPAKSYSGGGHSYSSHSSGFGGSHSYSSGSHSFGSGSSHSFSSGGGHSFSSGSSRSSGSTHSSSSSGGSSVTWHSSSGPGKTSSSGSGHSYSSGSVWNGSDKHSYTSGKSYSAGPAHSSSSGNSSFDYDSAAARAQREASSKRDFTRFKDSQNSAPTTSSQSTRSGSGSGPSSTSQPAGTLPNSRSSIGGGTYIPDRVTIVTRPVRIYNVFNPYWSRPYVTYHDPYGSLFWWWLLDQTLEDRAWWAYHHRYDMDPYRYQALVQADAQLEQRVEQLEAQQAPRDPTYTPPGLDRDLMYSDQHVQHLYDNRPTHAGAIAFWLIGVPAAALMGSFFIWLIWFKRWQVA
ncbi:MAG: hypothetical protein C5B50_28035 [Verrucomicrobia bacterium]|nr:MAG: hypothetical protein C5B50_28035 [Verrucomicrobiota bacterium]